MASPSCQTAPAPAPQNAAADGIHHRPGPDHGRGDGNKERDGDRSCSVCGKPCTTRCSGCRSVYYCSVDCQRWDWKDGGHRLSCPGRSGGGSRPRASANAKARSRATTAPRRGTGPGECSRATPTSEPKTASERTNDKRPGTVAGPKLPPPTTVRNEAEAERVLEEFWSVLGSAASGEDPTEASEGTGKPKRGSSKGTNLEATSKSHKPHPSAAATKTTPPTANEKTTEMVDTTTITDPKPTTSTEVSSALGGLKTIHRSNDPGETNHSLSLPSLPIVGNEVVSFVAEEMPQICRFQLTMTLRQPSSSPPHERSSGGLDADSIVVSTTPLGRAASRTIVIIRRREANKPGDVRASQPATDHTAALFVGEFPRKIEASDVTWRVYPSNTPGNESSAAVPIFSAVKIVFRLPYPYDPSVAPGSLGGSAIGNASSSSTLDEINSVLCGSCHTPLILRRRHDCGAHDNDVEASSNNGRSNSHNKTAIHSSSSDTEPSQSDVGTIRRVFPLPVGHWDEIAEYLICYDGQPVVDFSAGSECAEPSMALQDASLLCFHRRDVEHAVCALAVDGYGEPTERRKNDANRGEIDGFGDLGTFGTKPESSLFVLQEPQDSGGPNRNDPQGAPGDAKEEEHRPNSEDEVLPSSAVVRGNRSWQDAADGDSVSLCCGRCCAPIGFASLGSPETWRFWKHRLCLPMPKLPQENEQTRESEYRIGENPVEANHIPFQNASLLQPTKPFASCSSFLARELVRYAESKAIFTFIVRCEETEDDDDDAEGGESTKSNSEIKCLLLRLLSWETAIATSFEINDSSLSSRRRLRFQRVAKIVFEETIDPTASEAAAGASAGHNGNGSSATTQWFWGGVDLCCPPPSAAATKTSAPKASSGERGNEGDDPVSTVRLQLPRLEYDRVLDDLVSGRSLFQKEVADATIMLKMGGMSEGLGLTAVALE